MIAAEPASERSVVHYGHTEITYQIRRSQRRATVSVAVDPSLGVLLTAPEQMTVAKLDNVVHRKAAWIVEQLRLVTRSEPQGAAKEFVSGESVLYLGRHYRLRVVTADESGDAHMDRGWLVVPVLRATTAQERPQAVRAAQQGWFIARALQCLPERVALYAGKVGTELPRVLVRSQRKRWGSCDNRGVVRFNWRIMQAPIRLVDYVVAHELCHLRHKNHSRNYWNLLGRVLPDYEQRRAELMGFGPRAEW